MVENDFERVKLVGLSEDHLFSNLVVWQYKTHDKLRAVPNNRNRISGGITTKGN